MQPTIFCNTQMCLHGFALSTARVHNVHVGPCDRLGTAPGCCGACNWGGMQNHGVLSRRVYPCSAHPAEGCFQHGKMDSFSKSQGCSWHHAAVTGPGVPSQATVDEVLAQNRCLFSLSPEKKQELLVGQVKRRSSSLANLHINGHAS